ncbi:Hypothetical predicted protein [Lecanosticta acicola]|uniref:BTB domain-containing protein n=1 Tax=Lecanosticta acicola TaxID=111012 RepID=A0AAI8YVM2_9PEZI|nr:Hypothetical predicted protein [Lecanosticta acicola]
MPSNHANGAGRTQSAARNTRNPPNRVLPAIPLALSRPKSARPSPPKSEDKTRAAAVDGTSKGGEEVKADVVNGVRAKPMQASEASDMKLDDTPALATPTADRDDQAKESNFETPGSRGSAPMSLSNGATPEAPSTALMHQPAPFIKRQEEPVSTANTVAPPSARKPTDRFDMRQIRTELPPAFVPSSDRQTPLSATSHYRPPPILSHAHPSHPSAGSIVFGGHDSSTSSPAPPMSAGSAYPPPPVQQPHQLPYSRVSEPPSQHVYQPAYPHALPSGRFDYANVPPPPAQPYYHPHGQMPPRFPAAPHRDNYTNGHTPNGYGLGSRQGSRHSSAAHDTVRSDGELQSPIGIDYSSENLHATFRDGRPPRQNQSRHQHNPSMPFQGTPPNPDYAQDMENLEALRANLLWHFRNPDLSDCHLQISEESGSGRQYMDAHKLVLARSPTLLNLVNTSEPPASATPRTQVYVVLKGQYLRVAPFVAAVAFLYGGPLPSVSRATFATASSSPDERMQIAVQYIAMGMYLRIMPIADRGMGAALEMLTWETIPAAMAFGLDGGLGSTWPIEDAAEERTSTCSSEDSFSKPEAGGSPTYDPYSSTLLHRTADYIVHNFPPEFYLDPAAPQLEQFPRLPAAPVGHQSKPSRSDPRLSKIRFGEAPASHEQRPDSVITHISSILLSLPFPLLKFVLEHPALSARLGPDTVGSIMRQVINEREIRRQKAQKARNVMEGLEVGDSCQSQNLSWEEFVEQSNQTRAGCRLARRRRGIDTPPSSGTESERVK